MISLGMAFLRAGAPLPMLLAEELDVIICPELPSPTPIKHEVVDEYIEFIKRTGTKHFGILIDTGSRGSVFGGYLFGAALMLVAAIIAARFAVRAERKPLESVARPLNAVD